MKKLVAILLAGVLVLGCSVTAFAAGSPSATAADVSVTASATDANGTSVEIVVSQEYETTEQQEAADEMAASPTATLEALINQGLDLSDSGLTADEATELVFKAVMDVKPVGDTSLINWPVTIRFNISGVTTDSKVLVLHYINGAWVAMPVTLGDGYIDVTFDSLSPVAIFVDEETLANANSSAGVTTSDSSSSSSSSPSSSATSPETGEFPLAGTLGVVAAAAVIGMLVAQRRRYTEA
ncbi:MAG: hypothetical protein LUG54_07075 [Clostridiales bacterium]|nr:hypothetical protein [Clostridiales bacterium]